MRTLQAFWAWVDNEAHVDWAQALDKMRGPLSWTAQEALELAAKSIARRIVCTDEEPLANLDVVDHREALRDLSLAFCEALEKMHERVAKPEPGITREYERGATERLMHRALRRRDDLADGQPQLIADAVYIPTQERFDRANDLLAKGAITAAEWETVMTGEFSPDLPEAEGCERCGNPKRLHYPYPSEVGSCVPRVPGQFEPVHGGIPLDRRGRGTALHVFGPSQALEAGTVVAAFSHPDDISTAIMLIVTDRGAAELMRGRRFDVVYLHASLSEVDKDLKAYALDQVIKPGLTNRDALFVVPEEPQPAEEFSVAFVRGIMRRPDWQISGWSLEDVRRVTVDGRHDVEVIYSRDVTYEIERERASFLIPVSAVTRDAVESRSGHEALMAQLRSRRGVMLAVRSMQPSTVRLHSFTLTEPEKP